MHCCFINSIYLQDGDGTFILMRMELDNYTTWLEIDLGALKKNFQILQKETNTSVMPVIKANAYGHGLEEVAKTLEVAGAEWCGVARIEEALMLRAAGIGMKILVLGYVSPQRIPDVIKHDISLTLYDFSLAEDYANQAKTFNKVLKIQVKVDTGMGRLGIPHEQAMRLVQVVKSKPEFILEAVYTHFACADEPDKPYTDQQLTRFLKVLNELEGNGLRPNLVHAANSAATVNYPQSRFDLVRCGLALYGITPSRVTALPEGILPTMAWKTRLISIKELPANHGVSYGFRYFTSKPEKIGVIAAGYADGFRRRPGNHVLVRGMRVPVVGNICMDQCMLQLDDVQEAKVGDEVVLIGRQGGQEITASEIADDWGTISYEVICGMAARMPREYFR